MIAEALFVARLCCGNLPSPERVPSLDLRPSYTSRAVLALTVLVRGCYSLTARPGWPFRGNHHVYTHVITLRRHDYTRQTLMKTLA